ncbi:uncharacterized protein LOC124875648 isoform X2 [Girardinichthys multiradiatus]|uniref:uncharacterized protein LOC124875648 isoform X2 n=1 Tax=Girardinichthys multiradiatus TaxID=208333 RepID=UPI001FABD527|nr:uncharacterized protein LOC124875648 isoform X2 [Girardinichthys multiradiatus]
MDNKDSSYLKTSSFQSSSLHFDPLKTHFMTKGTSQLDQAGGMGREFKRGEVLIKLFTHLAPSSPWRRLEIAGSLQDWLEARKDFFPDPRIHRTIEADQQRALGEIVASMRRRPTLSSIRLTTEAGGGFLDHVLAPDQPSPLLPTPNPILGAVSEGFMDESPPLPAPVPGSVPEGSQTEPPSHFVLICEGLMDGLPPLPAPLPGPVLEGSVDELPPSLIPLPEVFVEDLSPLPVPVPEGCEDISSPPAVSQWLRRRYPRPHRRSQWSPHRSTVGSPGPAAGCQIFYSYVAGLLIACRLKSGSSHVEPAPSFKTTSGLALCLAVVPS